MKLERIFKMAVRILNFGPLLFVIGYFAVLAFAHAESAFSTLMSRWVTVEVPSWLSSEDEEMADWEIPSLRNSPYFTSASRHESHQSWE